MPRTAASPSDSLSGRCIGNCLASAGCSCSSLVLSAAVGVAAPLVRTSSSAEQTSSGSEHQDNIVGPPAQQSMALHWLSFWGIPAAGAMSSTVGVPGLLRLLNEDPAKLLRLLNEAEGTGTEAVLTSASGDASPAAQPERAEQPACGMPAPPTGEAITAIGSIAIAERNHVAWLSDCTSATQPDYTSPGEAAACQSEMTPICLLALTIGDQAGDCTADGCRANGLLLALPGTACVRLRRACLAVPCRTARSGIAGSASRWPLRLNGLASCVCCILAPTSPGPLELGSVGRSLSSSPAPQRRTLSRAAS